MKIYRIDGTVAWEGTAETLRGEMIAAAQGGADLRDANLRGADLSGASLSGASLSGADLSDADLRDANLRGADLSGASLSGASLSGADLSDADLRDANLRGADLSGASLSGASLSGANGIIAAGYPNGWCAYGWLDGGYLSIRVGCRELRLAEGRAYWSGKIDRREVLAALDYIEAVAGLRGWHIEAVAAAPSQPNMEAPSGGDAAEQI